MLSGLQPLWIKCSCVPVVLWLKICMLTAYFPALFLFCDLFFFPLALTVTFGGYSADAGLSILYLDAIFFWMLKAGMMDLFFHHTPLLLITHLTKAELVALSCSATARRSKLANAVWSGQRNKVKCQLLSRGLEFALCCCPPPASVSVFFPE